MRWTPFILFFAAGAIGLGALLHFAYHSPETQILPLEGAWGLALFLLMNAREKKEEDAEVKIAGPPPRSVSREPPTPQTVENDFVPPPMIEVGGDSGPIVTYVLRQQVPLEKLISLYEGGRKAEQIQVEGLPVLSPSEKQKPQNGEAASPEPVQPLYPE